MLLSRETIIYNKIIECCAYIASCDAIYVRTRNITRHRLLAGNTRDGNAFFGSSIQHTHTHYGNIQGDYFL